MLLLDHSIVAVVALLANLLQLLLRLLRNDEALGGDEVVVAEVRGQDVLLRAWQVQLRLVVELDLSLPCMQPVVVSVLVSVVRAGFAGRVLPGPRYVLHELLISGDPLSHDLFS